MSARRSSTSSPSIRKLATSSRVLTARARYAGTEAGSGKRGGARVIYFHLVGDQLVLLVMVYAKAERTNVKPKDIKRS